MMTKENILKKLYDIKKGTTDVNQLINAIEYDLLKRPARRLKKDRVVGIKHILEIGRRNGISPAWQHGIKIDGKTVITNGYTVAMLNGDLLGEECENADQVRSIYNWICDARSCITFDEKNVLPSYQTLRNLYAMQKSRGGQRPKYYIDECQRAWNLQYLLDAMRLFDHPKFYGYNSGKTFVVIAEEGDTDLNEFAIVMGLSREY